MEHSTDANGTKYWFKGNKLHREKGPAKEYVNGDVEWYYNGKLHRENGPAITEREPNQIGRYRYEVWYKHGKIHRLDGPAVTIPNGDKEWWVNGEKTGPLITDENGCIYEIKNGHRRIVHPVGFWKTLHYLLQNY